MSLKHRIKCQTFRAEADYKAAHADPLFSLRLRTRFATGGLNMSCKHITLGAAVTGLAILTAACHDDGAELLAPQAPQQSVESADYAGIEVNTTDDELNSDGDCSLREAIQAANTDTAVDACTAGSGADAIVVSVGTYTLSIAGANEDANATGDLDISADLTINGAGDAVTIIDGADLDRVFHILGGTVEIFGLTIQNGTSPDASDGGGIFNVGVLTLNSSTVDGNVAFRSGGTGGRGGGIFNVGGLLRSVSTRPGSSEVLRIPRRRL